MLRGVRASILALSILAAGAQAAGPGVWKIAPKPPESWQRDRVADLAARRKAVMNEIGEQGVLILYSAEPRNYSGDVDWPYRQENNFFYLTGISQAGNMLVLIPGAKTREVLFMAPSNPSQETWTGHRLTPEEARGISGIASVQDARNFNTFLAALLPNIGSALTEAAGGRGGAGRPSAPAPALPAGFLAEFQAIAAMAEKGAIQIHMLTRGAAEFRREMDFAAKLAALTPAVAVKDASNVFSNLRRVKSARELDILKHAIAITEEAFQRVHALAAPGMPEYEIQAQFELTFLRRNGHWGYPCIVASGVNATTLHYQSNQDTMKAGDLLLLDDGAEFDGYSADVTRTIPVSGKFSKEQAEIYRLVWNAQQAAIRNVRPGRQVTGGADSVTGAANEIFRHGLVQLGLMTDPASDQQLRIWFNHGISHGIGLNVHDPGGRELQPGMAVTVEPGVYIRPDALDNLAKTPENEKFIAAVRPAFEKYKGIGVRIEDDVLVTDGQPQVLSALIPSRLEDVEAAIANLRKAVKSTPLP
jgi:Xaa-Pro aminopeptidase